MRGEAGWAEDRGEAAELARGPFTRTAYLPNRGVDAGRYLRTALAVDWRPDVAGEFVRPGLGGRLYAERGDGGLRYTRVEGRLAARRDLLPGERRVLGGSQLALALRADAGVVAGGGADGPPPQQLFELGRGQNLLGYGYKAFAGDRAAAARGLLLFTGSYLRTPLRVRRFILPAVAPGLAFGAQAGWAEASDSAARASLARLGTRPALGGGLAPASRATDGVRASVSAGGTLFGGSVFVGVARPVDAKRDRRSGWRWVVTFAQVL